MPLHIDLEFVLLLHTPYIFNVVYSDLTNYYMYVLRIGLVELEEIPIT